MREFKEVIERLKATRPTGDREGFAEGYTLGKAWASDTAMIDELERLTKFAENPKAFESPQNKPKDYRASERMAVAIVGEPIPHRSQSDRFWRETAGFDAPPSDGVAQGFARGAVAVWNAVKDRVLN